MPGESSGKGAMACPRPHCRGAIKPNTRGELFCTKCGSALHEDEDAESRRRRADIAAEDDAPPPPGWRKLADEE